MNCKKRQIVDLVRQLGLNRANNENFSKGLRIDLKISGKASRQTSFMEYETIPIKDLPIQFQTFTCSNYKEVFMKAPKEILDFIFGSSNETIQDENDDFEFYSIDWVRMGNHDSCWTEGFNLENFKIEEISIEKNRTYRFGNGSNWYYQH